MADETDDLLKEKFDIRNGRRDVEDFLDTIRKIESSGGTDTDHDIMQSGIHKGQAAQGQYGLMPDTIQEMARRSGNREIASTPIEQIPSQLQQNPELEQQTAMELAQRVLARQGSPEKAAYSWNMGHNLTPEEVDKRDYMNSPYVQKFIKLRQALKGK